ncbi:MAG TPA: 16S rRNA (adenine(1518)-N(6)/adenine(1519)-N(6))-dimethyltransferase RsmA [Clostridia bacterium]|nr:16S rRNA (adenine(1518)-N(6)/adenine(1519)-N(6))-dimethyltransferase RsmA [Clostridia bacterium]
MEIREILTANNFRYNKALGQNFITDKNLLAAIVSDALITEDDTVIEVGTGAGSLTLALAQVCKKVITFEVDKNLKPILDVTLKDAPNVELHFSDVLRLSDEELKSIAGGPVKVVANLPYYVTTPIMMRFFESSLDIKSLTFMVQKEVADRLIAKENTPDYGAITAVIALEADVATTRTVSRKLFFPQPNVDSAVVHIEKKGDKYNCGDIAFVKKVIKCAFMWRRKTLANNLVSAFSISKETSENILKSLNFETTIRGEKLSPAQFCQLAQKLKEEIKK